MRTVTRTVNQLSKLFAFLLLLTVAREMVGQGAPGQAMLPAHKTENVIIVMLDGLRWQEVFHGADPKLINRRSPRLLGDSEKRTSQAKELYWRQTPEERRRVLMPF